jgi:hypothetical protein
VWFDVGNRDAVFVNNYVEGALVGFFFEISKGATVAGNVFVKNGDGARALNSADVHMFNNTFVDNPARFERNERSNVGDHFAWHPTTGPDVAEREGHVFVNNLVVASASTRGPLLQAEQAPALCGKLTKPMLSQVDGNIYVRPAGITAPLAQWSPADTPNCTAAPATLSELGQVAPGVDAKSRQIDGTSRDVFKAPDLMRYELRTPLKTAVPTPSAVLKMMGWKKGGTVGAYPALSALARAKAP